MSLHTDRLMQREVMDYTARIRILEDILRDQQIGLQNVYDELQAIKNSLEAIKSRINVPSATLAPDQYGVL